MFCESSIIRDEQEVVPLGSNGCEGIERASQAQGSNITTLPGQCVHAKCCQSNCNKRRIEQSLRDPVKLYQKALELMYHSDLKTVCLISRRTVRWT